ncbi:acetylornithine deacetylase/succinyl-diaminopimelate desuccinylase-like protein [Herbaspirillum sp. Sphag1AN]|uniref:M20 family metallopeptidase n=1 Tax=unclassified Herbaspirillum TaxID=2624150 RepID=UPI001812A020|nr:MULTISPECIES: M20 family metallopeptidase [unclassified Herbaspirillum]MBB3214708.1 acetylornithine deacetylase/succinyl-diaminopimelate desuccinylase-like protein [Herbaspirillum sp. Sphag1AN]MBB3247889.1 acetylornithine deacetylase/succinyl-diaminopimelate desuccinylase-like protein [Herbaspirillum sp. Sphag64]
MESAKKHYANGQLQAEIARRVSYRTESQASEQAAQLHVYLKLELEAVLSRMGFTCLIVDNPLSGKPPLLFAERHEGDDLLTVLTYGHGDVVRGYDDQWSDGLNPWKLNVQGDKWYGRGTADNKGQHSINLAALETVIKVRNGRLGYNVKCLFETGEEIGSPGLKRYCELNTRQLKSDVFIASDGPRLSASQPTIFLGSRGSVLFELSINLRSGGLHSGNWGGLMRNPATILANALASMVDGKGRILIPDLLPPPISPLIKTTLGKLSISDALMGREIDKHWGEPGMSSAEKLLGWNSLEVLAFTSGNPANPVNAIPPNAKAFCQLRFVVDTRWEELKAILRKHLDAHGFESVDVKVQRGTAATRLNPDNVWVRWAEQSMKSVLDREIAILPNLGGTLPNDVFANVLGLPTLWIPHSYPGCAQHAANEHMLASIADEGMQIMTSLFWDLGELTPEQMHQS